MFCTASFLFGFEVINSNKLFVIFISADINVQIKCEKFLFLFEVSLLGYFQVGSNEDTKSVSFRLVAQAQEIECCARLQVSFHESPFSRACSDLKNVNCGNCEKR